MLAFAVLAGILLLAPMRAGVEDALTVSVDAASLNPGETLALSYELVAETAQTVTYTSDDPSVAQVDQQGPCHRDGSRHDDHPPPGAGRGDGARARGGLRHAGDIL